MSAVVKTELNPSVDERALAEQAAEWLLELESSDPKIQEQFADWLAQSPRHVGAFLRASTIDALASELDPQKRIQIEVPAAVTPRWRWSLAAGVCLLMISFGVFHLVRQMGVDGWGRYVSTIRKEYAPHLVDGTAVAVRSVRPVQTISTEVGERKTLQPVTGAELELNTNSIVHLDLEPTSRSVVLEQGEMILNVAQDSGEPWVLRCDDLEVELTSAKVHVRYEASGFSRVDVISGVASVRRAEEGENPSAGQPRLLPVSLRAGEFFTTSVNVGIRGRFDPADIDRRLAWTQGTLILAGDSLKDAVAEFNRYNTRQLVIGDERIAGLVTGGRFDVTDTDSFARSLNALFGVRAIRVPAGKAGPEAIVLVGPDFDRKRRR